MNYSPEELAEKIRTEYKQNGSLSDHLQACMKEVAESIHPNTIEKFSEVILPAFLEVLNGPPVFTENQENQARVLVLELLSKILLAVNNFSHYEKIFQVLLDIMQKDNENNGITAARLLSDILKSTTQHQFNFETMLKPLFSALIARAQLFYNRVDEIVRNPAQKSLYQISQTQPSKLIKSSESIKVNKLIMEIPNLFVYACHFVEPNNEFVKNALHGAINNFINALRMMPYQELAKNSPKQYFTEMINTVVKLFHFITLILKQQITNEKIREYLHSQTETIKSRADDMAECIMSFFRNVHDDFTSSRIELINYLRFHVKYLGPDKFKNSISYLLEDDVIFGKQKFKSIYGKNLIYQHWLETMQHLVTEMTLPQISRTFDIIAKNLYDNNLYNNIQYHSLILHQKIMEVHFLNRRGVEAQEHTQKVIATKILEKLILKFKQIKEKIVEINEYLETKYPNQDSQEKNPILLSNLPSKGEIFSEEDEDEWNKKKLKYIDEYDTNVDAYLFSQSWIHYKTLNIYEDEDELIINCWTINPSTVNEYLKEIKDKIVPTLFDSIRNVIDFISNNNVNYFNAPQGAPPRPQAAKLTEEECYLLGKLLKYGLICMDLLHNYKNPAEDRDKMLAFFIIFVGLQEQKNIKDIFETNFKSVFDITLKYAKHGTEESLQNLLSPLIDGPKVYERTPYMKQYSQQINFNWKIFAEIMIRQLFLKLENSPDELGPFHPYYEYQHEYHSIIYKLIKMCFRCLNKHQQDQFIEGIFKQIIMVLFKKTHSSKYSIEYILLLRNLFKNILNQKSDNLFVKFQQLCEYGVSKKDFYQQPNLPSLDIIKNFVALYEAGLPELNDVLSELILILPLRTKYLLFNSKMLISPIISALNLTDPDFLKRGLKTIDVILNNYQNYQNEDLDNLLADVKQKLISKLYFFMWNAQESDILYATSKLLGKLGHYPRTHKVKQKFVPLNLSDVNVDMKLIEREGKVEVNLSLVEAIRLSIDLIEQFFENKSLVTIKISCLENAWVFLQAVVHKLIEKQIDPDDLRKATINNITINYPQYGNRETYDIVSEIFKVLLIVASHAKKKELEEMFQNIANVFVLSYLSNIDKEEPRNLFFLYSIIDNIKYRIIYIRGSHNDTYYNNSYAIIKSIVEKVQNICTNPETDYRLYHLILLRLVRVCHTKELINCHGAINCLISLADLIPSRYFVVHYFDIMESVFNVIQKIPEVIQLPVFDKCLELLKILANFYPILNEQGVGLYHICDSLVNQLLSANENQHEAAKFFLKEVSKRTGVKFPLMFFESERGGPNRFTQLRFEGDGQMQISRAELIKENLPISKILQLQDKIFSELSTRKIQKEQGRYLNLLRNSIDTLNLLMYERILPFRFVDEANYILTDDMKKLIFLFESIIAENDKIYKPYVYIIMEEERKPVDQVHPQPQATQNYTINKNILYDDDEFNVNIEDVDLTIKVWSKLLSSALVLMQNIMTHRSVNAVIKFRINRRDRHDRVSEEVIETRNKVIFKFFNMMLRIERTIRKTASRGLKTLIRLENQPKDLLTEDNLKVILRPILICLQQQHQIFNIPFLNVLRKLVKYLNQCFNRTLSDKLAEHLTKFMEVLCSGNRRYQGPEPVVDERKIASGIFYLFEYLPHASQYVDLIIKLNNKIDNTIVQLSGMYCMNYLMRKPLLRIVNCYASGSVELFLTNLKDYSKIFLYVLKADCSHAIRERLMRETQNFLERTFHNQPVFDLTSEAIRIIRIISKRNPSWLLKNKIIPSLLSYWNAKDLKQQPADDEFAKDRNRDDISQILKIFVQYCKSNKKEIKIIFDILPIFNLRHSTDFSFLHKFYRYYIPENYSSEEKRDIFLYFLEYIKGPHPIETKANASYILIYPMMLKCFKNGKAREMFATRVIDEVCSLVSELARKKPTEYGRLEIEILQICSLIITYLKDEYMNHQGGGDERKIDLLRLGWNLMKNEDRVYANIAKLFICKFISKYGLLYEQTMQLYVSLLKGQEYINSHDNDIKLLSRKALDILIPYLPNVRSQNVSESANNPPKWVTWTCRIFNEENWVNSQSTEGYSFARFWQVFIRMHKIFAKYKSFFSTQMINSMQYLVLPHHQSSMYKKIAIDLALLYMEWHYQDLKEKIEKEGDYGRKITILNQPFNEQNKDIREIFVNFFIKLAINSCQDKEEKENITRKALFLLKKWLIISPGSAIKYQFIEKTLNGAQSSTQYYNKDGTEKKKSCFTVLMIVSTLLSFDRPENIQSNMDLIFKILTHPFSNCFTCDNPYIIQLISNLTKKLLSLNNQSFLNKITDLVESGVNAYIQAYQSRSSNQNQFVKNAITIYTTIRISKVLLEYKPDELDKFFEAFLQISKIFIELFDNRRFYNAPTARKAGDEDEDLLANIDNHYTEEGFENHKFSFSNLREFLIILLRILSQKLTKFSNPDSKEKLLMVELLESIMEKLPDIDLTLEVLSILNSLLLSDYYTNVKSHIPLVKGCFTTKEKILCFLDCKKVQYIMDKHHGIRHHDGERVVRKYSKLIIDLLHAIPLKEIEMERLRKLIVILNKYVPTDMSDQLFKIVDNHFGDSFKKKIMFFFYELSDETHLEEHSEGDEDLLSTVVNYFIYMIPQYYEISGPAKVFPFPEKFQNNLIMQPMEVENPGLNECINQVMEFMNSLRTYPVTDLLIKFRKLLTVEYYPKREILRFYFNFLFSLTWYKLPRGDQQVIIQALENYLTNRNCSVSANAILYTAENLYPSVRLKPEIILYLAKTNYTWHTSLSILEKYSELETEEEFENSILSLIELYTRLDEKDFCYGLKRLICEDYLLKRGLTLSQHRLWVKAGKTFSTYIENSDYEQNNMSDILHKRVAEEGWMNVHKQLNDWGNIHNVIKDIGNVDLHIELAWQTKDKRTLEKFIQSTESFNADSLMIQSILRLSTFAETVRNDDATGHKRVDESISGSLYCSLLEWNALPKYFINSHKNILVRLQSLVEIDEATSIISKIKEKDTIEGVKEHFAHQLIAHMDIWKSRMPSKVEDLTVWKTIVDQRNYLYHLIKKRLELLLSNNPSAANPSLPAGNGANSTNNTMPSTPIKEAGVTDVDKKLGYFSDIIWNNLKYASIERRFEYFGQMKGANTKLWNESPQTPGEIYLAMKEQIMWRLNTHYDHENAMKIANNAINHELLSIEHKSEMHRLKVLINMQLGKLEEANNECIEALKICDTNWKCWHTWAVFCFKSFCHLKQLKWAEQTIVCFMNAIKYKPHKTRLLVADILWMLTHDDRQAGQKTVVLKAFEKAVEDLPVWIWILWIPQFLAAIIKGRTEAKIGQEVLKKVAREYPQAIWYYLKRFKQSNPSHAGFEVILVSINEIYEEIRKTEPTLHECIESFSEFIPTLNITQEEKMINEINSLVTSLYLLDNLVHLDRFRLKIFLMLRSFESHIQKIPFNEIIRMQSATISEILGILKSFINNMKDMHKPYSKAFFKVDPIKLMKLQSFMSDLIEIPGQYNANHEPYVEKHVKILEIGKEIECVEKNRAIMKILSLRGTNGKTYQYHINNRLSSSAHQEPLVIFSNNQLKQIMNIRFASNKENSIRNLKLKGLVEFFVNSEVSLVEYKPKLKNLSDLLDEFMVSKDLDPDYALESYLKENTFGIHSAKQDIYKKMDKIVPNDVLKKFALRSVKNLDEYFIFRNNFICSFGMENFFSYVISNELLLEHMYIDSSKGTFYYMDLKPCFSEQGKIAKENASNSMRISKNIETFITSMGLEGLFASCYISSSLAFARHDTDLSTLLFVYVRDCLMKMDQQETPKKDVTENAEELKERIKSFSFEKENTDEINDKIYRIIIELTNAQTRILIPKKFKYWF